ncbi:MAG: xylulokinase [Anaerolineae bacterium]|nr:xylulokinase [Anaerolineae bacterium]
MGKYLIGIDLGTSSLKALLLDSQGHYQSPTSFNYPTHSPLPNYSEQDAGDWYSAAVMAIRSLISETGVKKKQIEGISFSGQMHGLVCVDHHGNPARNAIIWSDQRSAPQVQRIYSEFGKENYGLLTGNPLSTGFMLPSWLWVCENESSTAKRTRFLMLPKDYLRYKISGDFYSDPSDAASTGLFDVAEKTWCQSLLEACAIPETLLPEIRASHQAAGQVAKTVAAECDLLEGTPLFVGGGDTAVQALGRGIYRENEISLAISTGGNLLAISSAPRIDRELRLHCMNYVLPDLWYNMAATLSAGYSLKWLKENFAPELSFASLADLAQDIQSSQGLFFLPHLRGERTPYMDPKSRGVLIGLTSQHRLAHFVRAVMEGVVFSLKAGFDTMKDLKVNAQSITMSGGGVQHPLWIRLVADIFARPIRVSSFAYSAPLGAAMLAGIGSGIFSDFAEACQVAAAPSVSEVFPDAKSSEQYRRMYEQYQSLYPLVKEFYKNEVT